MTARLAALAFCAGLAVLPSAFAQESADYVAAALSKSTGTVGFAVNDNADAARNMALAECQSSNAPDCEIALAGTRMCISLARATSRPALGLGAGASRASSQSTALSECAKNGAEGCNIHDTYCAPKTLD